MKFQSNMSTWKCKYNTAPPSLYVYNFWNKPCFGWYHFFLSLLYQTRITFQYCYLTWLYHLISQINNSAGYLCLVSDKSWKVCQEQSNGVTDMSLNNTVYDSELVTTKMLYCNYIHFMQKLFCLCPNLWTHYPTKQKGQFSLYEWVHWLYVL